uniref:Secreted protein n=1 Tax=Strongyloides venezuelensis TaxID=75913 RepID=A0A0K0F7F7_STRVS
MANKNILTRLICLLYYLVVGGVMLCWHFVTHTNLQATGCIPPPHRRGFRSITRVRSHSLIFIVLADIK